MKLNLSNTLVTIIQQKDNESYQQFLTLLANEIQTMQVKIVYMDIDIRGKNTIAIIHYKNL